jgi:hypothetical protein
MISLTKGALYKAIDAPENFIRAGMMGFPEGLYLIRLQTDRNHTVKTMNRK